MNLLRLQSVLFLSAFVFACTDTSINRENANRGEKNSDKGKKSTLAKPNDADDDDIELNPEDEITQGDESESNDVSEVNGESEVNSDDDGTESGTNSDDAEIDSDGDNDNGNSELEIDEETIARCKTNPVEKSEETENVPALPDGNFKVGDMDRKKVSGTPTIDMLQKHINNKCAENNSQWTDASPTVSGDKATRDLICKIYGYQQAGDAFGYFKRSSPKNDWAGHWNTSTNRYEINYDASQAPTNNINVLWTSCKGKLYDSCKKLFMKNDFKCK